MTPKERALELVNKFGKIKLGLTEKGEPYLMAQESFIEAKQCALISVDEIISDNASIYSQQYWNEVKQEIEKL